MDSSASSSERLTTRTVGVRARSALLAAAGGVAFALVLWGGYSRRWPWTGISGRTATLWDWLNLLFVAVVLGGYLASWRWTGFTGNTLWDWLHLLLLPLLLPTVILPAVKPLAMRRMVIVGDDQGTEREGAPPAAEERPPPRPAPAA